MNDTATLIYSNDFYSQVGNTKLVEESDRWIGTIPPLGAGNSEISESM